MAVQRCTVCTHDNEHPAPAVCVRCGADSFCLILGPNDHGAPAGGYCGSEGTYTKSSGHQSQPEPCVFGAGHDGRHSWQSDPPFGFEPPADDVQRDEAPATPRDMPEQPDDDDEPLQVGPDPRRDADPSVCSQEGCDEPAAHRFTWPGNPEQRCCSVHSLKARDLASAMGFELQVLPLVS